MHVDPCSKQKLEGHAGAATERARMGPLHAQLARQTRIWVNRYVFDTMEDGTRQLLCLDSSLRDVDAA